MEMDLDSWRTGDVYNTNATDYIYMAFAEDPYKYAEGR